LSYEVSLDLLPSLMRSDFVDAGLSQCNVVYRVR
jgi:hypothetical protein